MATVEKDRLACLSADDVRRIVNRWCDRGFFRVKGLGDKIFIEDIIPHCSYVLSVSSQYEERSVSRGSAPYHGGPVDNDGTPPGPWDIPVRRPTDFTDRTEKIPVPHTERISTCQDCGGDGRINCSPCQGWGKINCTSCQGKGFRETTRHTPATDQFGQPTTDQFGRPVMRTETVRENCPFCHGMGKVTCTTCNGCGKVTCGTCDGSGKVKLFDLLTVKVRTAELSDMLDATGMPQHLIGQAVGRVLVHERGERLEQVPSVTPDVDSRARMLLEKSRAVNPDQARLLFQELRIEQVGIQEVVYRYGNSPNKSLWIYGENQDVYAPGAPTAWWKILLLIGIVVTVCVGGVAALLAFF